MTVHAALTRSEYARQRRGRQRRRVRVCPSCGAFTIALDQATGWCRLCVKVFA